MSILAMADDFSTDSEDDDYVPSAEDSEDHYVSSGAEKEQDDDVPTKGKKRQKNQAGDKIHKRKGGIKLDEGEESAEAKEHDDDDSNDKVISEKGKVDEVKEKVRSDSLWADFLKDTGSSPSKASNGSSSKQESEKEQSVGNSSSSASQKVTVTKVYNFAGEEVKVEEKVDAKEAADLAKKTEEVKSTRAPSPAVAAEPSPSVPRRSGGGLGSVLGKISGKPKIGTLEKSRLDWKQFTNEEGIEEELQTHNKGKHGYLERQAFLERSDHRQFEVERGLRRTNRSNR